jgi:GTPase Era involved in 16S rRNA processing
MNTYHPRHRAERVILAALPGRAHDVARLRALAEAAWPVVTVIGKYNHGKSRLLNEMIGHAAFSVADKHETVALGEHVHDGVYWLDAPGLGADVHTVDDDHALQAIWLQSDIRLFVHAVKEGELDAAERSLVASLRQMLFVASQVDQLASDRQMHNIVRAIGS